MSIWNLNAGPKKCNRYAENCVSISVHIWDCKIMTCVSSSTDSLNIWLLYETMNERGKYFWGDHITARRGRWVFTKWRSIIFCFHGQKSILDNMYLIWISSRLTNYHCDLFRICFLTNCYNTLISRWHLVVVLLTPTKHMTTFIHNFPRLVIGFNSPHHFQQLRGDRFNGGKRFITLVILKQRQRPNPGTKIGS